MSTLWPARQTQVFEIGGHQLALPSDTGPRIFLRRRDVLAQSGQPEPSPEWTHTEVAALWTALSGVIACGKGRRYGAALTLTNPDGEFLFGGWGGPCLSGARTACTADTPGEVQAMSADPRGLRQQSAAGHLGLGGGNNSGQPNRLVRGRPPGPVRGVAGPERRGLGLLSLTAPPQRAYHLARRRLIRPQLGERVLRARLASAALPDGGAGLAAVPDHVDADHAHAQQPLG